MKIFNKTIAMLRVICLTFFLGTLTSVYPATFVIEENGIGISIETATDNAVKSLMKKIYTVKQSTNQNTINLTPVVNGLIKQNIDYEIISQSEIINTVIVGITTNSIQAMFDFMVSRHNQNIVSLSILERQQFVTEAQEFEYLLKQVSEEIFPEIVDMIVVIQNNKNYFYKSLNMGIVAFSIEITDDIDLTIDGIRLPNINNDEQFVTPGLHTFSMRTRNHYPIDGKFTVKKGEIKSLTPPLVLIPTKPLIAKISSNLSSKQKPYINWLFQSYGWKINEKSSVTAKVNKSATSVPQENNIVKHFLQINVTLELLTSDDEGKSIIQKIAQKQYVSDFLYSRNNKKAVPREERLLIMKSLIRFLSELTEEDYQDINLANTL